jgi:hypothetical protein
METPNTRSLNDWLQRLGASDDQLTRVYRSFNAEAEAFREASEAHERR